VYASYNDFDYLMEHWDEECILIRRWANIIGVNVQIEKPPSMATAVGIHFAHPLQLDDPEEDISASDQDP